MSNKKVGGWVFTVLGIIGSVYSIMTIVDDTSLEGNYNYNFPFSTHEIMMIVLAAMSIIALIEGIFAVLSDE